MQNYQSIFHKYGLLFDEEYASLYREPNGIHGVSHAKRVVILLYYLFREIELEEYEMECLMQAAYYHDIGRRNNSYCTKHGYWSIEKMIQIGLHPSELLQNIIIYHCISDRKIIHIPTKWKILCYLFKDADALDRVRTNDLNEKYLRFIFSKKYVEFAKKLNVEIL